MRAYIGAEVTLDTVVWVPYRDVNCNAAFFKCSGTRRCLPIFIFLNNGNRNLISFLPVYWDLDIIYKVYNVLAAACCNFCKAFVLSVFPACRNFNLYNACCASVDGVIVHLYDLVALLAVGCLCSSLHQLNCPLLWDDGSQLEECRLEYCIDTPAKPDFFPDLDTVDGIELDVVFSDISLYLSRQVAF